MTEQEIAELLQKAATEAEKAAMPHYKAAGEKLLEAQAQLPQDEFWPWVKRNFNISKKKALLCMSYANPYGANQHD